MGIQVLPPDVLQSEKKFSVHDGAVRFGMMGIKNVGDAVIDEIIRARKEYNPSGDFEDFINSLDISKINKKAIESLIRAGPLIRSMKTERSFSRSMSLFWNRRTIYRKIM